MKALLLFAMLLVTGAAQAEWVARAQNNAGGQIVLTDTKGSCKAGLRMYSASSEGTTSWGCWAASDLHVFVVYDNGSTRAYDYSGWTMNPNNPAFQSNTPAPASGRHSY